MTKIRFNLKENNGKLIAFFDYPLTLTDRLQILFKILFIREITLKLKKWNIVLFKKKK